MGCDLERPDASLSKSPFRLKWSSALMGAAADSDNVRITAVSSAQGGRYPVLPKLVTRAPSASIKDQQLPTTRP